jgi:hypothetical protein
MDDNLYSGSITNRERDARLNTYLTQLATTMLMLSQELMEMAESRDVIDLSYLAALIEDSRKASELSKELIARIVS